MSSELGMLPSHLSLIIRTAPLRYKVFEIPKKAGGSRTVAQPAREVKAIQRWVIRELTAHLPIHEAAMAYRPGVSIRRNAELHAASRYMLKLDFTNFFPSILRSDISSHLQCHCSNILSPDACELVAHVCCWAPDRSPPLRLCIGAPSSPLLSNSIMFEFDNLLASISSAEGVTYTRYADDITLSSRERGKIDRYERVVRDLLAGLDFPKLKINAGKTVYASRAGKRVVTGLVLTPEGDVSIGRDRKRLIRAMYHRSVLNELPEKEAQELAGLIAFADSIEPGFSARLKRLLPRS
ncbi:hypothetical protein B2J89_19765 [Acidovorax sp. SRB_24]|nr:retron St85 family RNA-directed DNA polymerase [Acidovorax sp. SRB_24]NMM78886.1 hypothetical protein [Acidovorax sp. SRB_24]